MSQIVEMVNRREEIWKELKDKRREFDDSWRDQHKHHNCDTKVYAENGEWFCHHLTMARNREFKEQLDEEDSLVVDILLKVMETFDSHKEMEKSRLFIKSNEFREYIRKKPALNTAYITDFSNKQTGLSDF